MFGWTSVDVTQPSMRDHFSLDSVLSPCCFADADYTVVFLVSLRVLGAREFS